MDDVFARRYCIGRRRATETLPGIPNSHPVDNFKRSLQPVWMHNEVLQDQHFNRSLWEATTVVQMTLMNKRESKCRSMPSRCNKRHYGPLSRQMDFTAQQKHNSKSLQSLPNTGHVASVSNNTTSICIEPSGLGHNVQELLDRYHNSSGQLKTCQIQFSYNAGAEVTSCSIAT